MTPGWIGGWLAALTVLTIGAIAVGMAVAYHLANLRNELEAHRDETDKAIGSADDAVAAVNQIIDHLTYAEPPSEGRHAMTDQPPPAQDAA